MKTYLVGGAVRDKLLGLPVADRDWLVVGGDAKSMLQQGFFAADAEFPVFIHPESGEEYALARREYKAGEGYRGFRTETGPDICLQDDLARRDLTINALALDEQGAVHDPFNGERDLQQRFLRHVTDAFVEDPVRVLRVARFAAKLGQLGFRVAHPTHRLMKQMVMRGDMNNLQAERFWQEMKKSLSYEQPWRFFEVLDACGALDALMPELAVAMPAVDRHEGQMDCDAISALKKVSIDMGDAVLRFSALMLSLIDTPGAVSGFCRRMRLQKVFCEMLDAAVTAWPRYRKLRLSDAAGIVDFLQSARCLHDLPRLQRLLSVFGAQGGDVRLHEPLLRAQKVLAGVTRARLLDSTLQGPAIGRALTEMREREVEKILLEYRET